MYTDFFMPVRLIRGAYCVRENAAALALGRHALLVTGQHSAKESGAFEDVGAALDGLGIPYTVFDRIRENPTVSVCREGGEAARLAECDFVIGIGGGSALDAAKAIAAYAMYPEAEEETIFTLSIPSGKMLPIVAVPTTAGTGSEANPYAVLTLPDGMRKKTFRHPSDSYPRVSFVDPRYTYSLNEAYTVSTGLDALAHAIESYLSPKSNDFSELFALSAARRLWGILFCGFGAEGTHDIGGYTPLQRAELSCAATEAGIAINTTGTGFPHPLGYSITLSDKIPHGRACGAFEGAFLEYNLRTETGARKIRYLAEYLRTSPEEMIRRIPHLADVHLSLTDAQIAEYIHRVAHAQNYANSPYILTRTEMTEIYRSQFGNSQSASS